MEAENGEEVTEKIKDKPAITVSSRRVFEESLSIRRVNVFDAGGDKCTSIRI